MELSLLYFIFVILPNAKAQNIYRNIIPTFYGFTGTVCAKIRIWLWRKGNSVSMNLQRIGKLFIQYIYEILVIYDDACTNVRLFVKVFLQFFFWPVYVDSSRNPEPFDRLLLCKFYKTPVWRSGSIIGRIITKMVMKKKKRQIPQNYVKYTRLYFKFSSSSICYLLT